MITGSEQESRALMMDAAVKIVAEYGLEGFTTKKWASTAGVAEGSLYYHFKSKNDLLDATFSQIDQEIIDVFFQVRSEYPVIRDLDGVKEIVTAAWKRFYEYLMQHPGRTVFYFRYRTSPRYNQTVQKQQFERYQKIPEALTDIKSVIRDQQQADWKIVWTYVMDSTVTFAFRILTGGLEYTEANIQQMARLFTTGIYGMLYPGTTG